MQSRNPLISIICAVRNDGRFIRETLESVVAQSYLAIELIIIDGASTDNTLEIVKEYAQKYPYIVWRSEPDQGQWDALEKGLALSKGKYVSLLCGQDGYLHKDWFKECIQAFNNNPDISLVWGVPFNMSEEGVLVGPHYAYAGFLQDDQFGLQTKPLQTLMAKINWRHPARMKRAIRFGKKITWNRIKMMLGSFKKRQIPQREHWFTYWLKTGRAFPEGNMCVLKEVFIKNTTRFPDEKMTNSALFDFCFNFNANGYMAYGLSLAASFGRSHAHGQPLLEYDNELTVRYYQKIENLKEKIVKNPIMTFIDGESKKIKEIALHI